VWLWIFAAAQSMALGTVMVRWGSLKGEAHKCVRVWPKVPCTDMHAPLNRAGDEWHSTHARMQANTHAHANTNTHIPPQLTHCYTHCVVTYTVHNLYVITQMVVQANYAT